MEKLPHFVKNVVLVKGVFPEIFSKSFVLLLDKKQLKKTIYQAEKNVEFCKNGRSGTVVFSRNFV